MHTEALARTLYAQRVFDADARDRSRPEHMPARGSCAARPGTLALRFFNTLGTCP